MGLYVQHRDNEGSLKLLLDGAPFGGSREFTNVLKDTSYKKTLVVQRGPRMFEYPPLDLVMESACEDETKSMSKTLYNRGAAENVTIEFLKECPKVEWAGELKRDRHFVVNTNSDDEENLLVNV